MGLQARDLENIDNLDPDDFDDALDTPENRGDVVDPNAEVEEETAADDTEEETEEESEDDTEEETEEESEDDAEEETEEESEDDAEEETEEESEDETEEEEDDVPETDLADEDIRIPKSRFDAVNERRKQAEQRLAELERQAQKTGESSKQTDRIAEIQNELSELDGKINDAILDADSDALKQLRAQERKLNNEAQTIQLQTVKQQAVSAAKYDALLDRVEADYPEYNPENENYNEDLVTETLDLQDAYIAKGVAKSEALLRAIDLIRPRYVDDSVESEKPSLRKPTRDTKTKKARNKKVAQSQPASTATRGSKVKTEPEIDVENIKDPDDLDKFDEKTLARLSGDFVE